MMTAEFMLSKRPVLRFTAALFFLLKLLKAVIERRFEGAVYSINLKSYDDVKVRKPS